MKPCPCCGGRARVFNGNDSRGSMGAEPSWVLVGYTICGLRTKKVFDNGSYRLCSIETDEPVVDLDESLEGWMARKHEEMILEHFYGKPHEVTYMKREGNDMVEQAVTLWEMRA